MFDIATLGLGVDARPVDKASASLDRLTRESDRAERSTRSLVSATKLLGGVIGSLSVTLLTREAIHLADAWKNLQGQMALVTKGADDLARSTKALFEIAQRTRTDLETTVGLYTRLARSTQDLGATQAQVLQVTETINKAMIVSGTNAEQASGALMQLGQAFASGALRGDELNSVMEGMPRLAKAIADGMGISIGQLRKLGAEGKLTGAEVFKALLSQKQVIEEEFGKMPTTVGQAMTQVRNSVLQLVGAMDKASGASATLVGWIQSAADFVNRFGTAVQAAQGEMVKFNSKGQEMAGIGATLASVFQAVVETLVVLGAQVGFVFNAIYKDMVSLSRQAKALARGDLDGMVAEAQRRTEEAFAERDAVEAFSRAILDRSKAAETAAVADASAAGNLRELGDTADKASKSLARQAAAMEASTRGAYALAEAYLQSDGSALKAEAARKAMTDATRRGADTEAQIRRQLALSIAEVAIDYAKMASGLEDQITAQRGANAAVADGVLSIDQANDAMEQELALRQLVAAASLAEGKAKEFLLGLIRQLDGAYGQLNRGRAEAAALASRENSSRQLEIAQLELTLIGKTNAERAIAIARMEKEQELRRLGGQGLVNSASGQEAIKKAGEAAEATERVRAANDNYNDSLRHTLELLGEVAAHTRSIADGLGDGLGRIGDAIGQMTSVFAEHQAVREQLRVDEDEARKKAAGDAKRLGEIEVLYAQKRKNAEVEANLASLGAFKRMFKEKSAAYKVLTAVETAYRAIQLAGTVKAMAVEAVHTAKSIAGALARGAADAAAGAAKMFSQLGVFAFPVVAAMVGLLVSLGLRIAGGGGSSPSIVTAEERQKTQGTGTVLGDAEAKSESIARSLELVEAHTNKDLEYSNSMLRALRSIDQNIGALTAALARQLGVAGGIFDSSGLGLGSSTKLSTLTAAFLGGPIGVLLSKIPVIGGIMKTLFGTKTTRTLTDQGLSFDAQSLEDILNSGLLGDAYQDVAVKKKKKFLGITYSNKTNSETTTSPLGDDILTEMARVLDSLRTGIISAAGVLGIEGADATLNAFVVEIGKISLKDMTGAEIQETLNAVFGKLGDQMAEAVFGQIGEFQKAGEGAMETLVRLARDYQVIDITLASIGKTFGQVGLASIAARERLVEFFGSLDDFVEQTAFFAENFLTDVERMVPIQAAVEKELTRLGLSGITTKDAFKNLVLGLDTSTAAGAEMYAALLALAPAFLKVVEFSTEGSKDMEDAGKRVKDAYSKLANDLQNTIDKFKGFADSLRKFRESLTTGPAAMLSPEAQYKATKSAFEQTAAKARLGDETALADLQSVSQAYLDASKAYYASSGPYFQDLEAVKIAVEAAEMTASRTASNAEQQLAALTSQVTLLGLIEENTRSFAEELAAYNAIKSAAGTSGGNGLPTFMGGSGTGALATFNGASYLAANPDVAAAYQDYAAGGYYAQHYPAGLTAEQFAQEHYRVAGQAEGRTGFATGGSFTVGGYGGPDSQNFGPIDLSPGEVVNVRRPGDVANDNAGIEARLDRVCEKLERLEAAQVRGASMVAETTRSGLSTLDRTVRTDPRKTDRLAGKLR